MDRQEFIYQGTSQALWFDAAEGRPSATPTVAVQDSGGLTLSAAADTNVTQDTVNTTISASSSVGDKSLTLTSVSGVVVGRSYLITNSLSQKERVRVVGINSSTKVVTLDSALGYDYASTNTFVSTLFYYTLQTADVATLDDNFVAIATYVVSSQTYKQRMLYDVVRYPTPNVITVEGMRNRWPDISRQEPAEEVGEDFARIRAIVWDDQRRELRQLGRRPSLIVSATDLETWAYAKLALYLQRNGVKVIRSLEQLDALQMLQQEVEQAKRDALSALTWYDEDDDQSLSYGDSSGFAGPDFSR